MIILAVISGLFGSVMLGRAAVQIVFPATTDKALPAAEIWGLSIVLGVGLTAWISFLWSWAGGTLGFPFSALLVGFGIISGLWAMRKSSTQTCQPNKVDGIRLVKSCQWIVGLLIVLAFGQTILTPQRFWDERAIFAIKAKLIFADGTISSPTLNNPEFVQYHPRYPLLLPMLEVHTYALLGDERDRWSKLWFPLLYAGLVLTFTGVCSRHFSAAWAWICGLLLATAPVLMPYEYGFLCAQADAPVACFHGIAVLYLWDGLWFPESMNRYFKPALSGFIASCAAFTKDEGIAYLIIDVSSWGMAIVITMLMLKRPPSGESCVRTVWQRCDAFRVILFVAMASVMLIPWFVHRRQLPDTTEMHYGKRFSLTMLSERLDTLHWSLPHLRRRMFAEWQQWGLHWWAGLFAIATRPRRAMELPQMFLILNLLGALAALLVAGMLAPAELEEHLGGASPRYLMQLVPVVMLLVASLWAEVKD